VFYLPQAVLAWVVSMWLVDWRRLRELLVFGLWGVLLTEFQDTLGDLFRLWEYRDTGPLGSHHHVSTVIGVSAAPLMGMYFTQFLQPGKPPPWGLMARVTAISLVPEVIALYTGNILHHKWWSMGWSAAAYVPVWLSFWALHRWLYRR
jgi:hypothetical protein